MAVQDILDAIQHIEDVDVDRIYVMGVSGGAHIALLLAALYPKLWAGVFAWSGILDLQAWWKERWAPTSK
jgi:predicted peptidase